MKKIITGLAIIALGLGVSSCAQHIKENNAMILDAQASIAKAKSDAIVACNGDPGCIVGVSLGVNPQVKAQKIETVGDFMRGLGRLVVDTSPLVNTVSGGNRSGDSLEVTAGGDVTIGSNTTTTTTGTTVGYRNATGAGTHHSETHEEVVFAPEE